MLAALMLWLPAEAQLHRGARTIVRGGMFVKPDSLRHKSDSLANNALARNSTRSWHWTSRPIRSP